MAEFINKYENNDAYSASAEASAREALGKSTVSLEADTRVVHFDGVNVEIPEGVIPDVGDALFIDNNGGKHFFSGKSRIAASSIPSGYEFCGVVAIRRGRKVWILHKDENNSVRFTSCWAWEITGITYGESNTIQFQQRKKTSEPNVTPETFENFDVGGPLVFTPTDIDDAVDKINAHLLSNQGGIAAGGTYDYNWHCAKIDGRVWVISDFTSPSYRQYEDVVVRTSGSSSGISSLRNMWILAGYGKDYTWIERKDGVTNGSVLWNAGRAKQYMASQNTNIGTPSDSLSSTGIYKESAWNDLPSGSVLKTTYGNYENYLSHMVVKYPTSKGAVGAYYGVAKDACARMAAVEYVPHAGGSPVKMFDAVDWAAGRKGHSTAQSDGVNQGDWYMPSLDEIFSIFGKMKIDGSDPVNKCFGQINNSSRSLSVSRWVPARYPNGNAWLLASSGYMNGNNFNNGYRACAVALLEF